MELVARLRYTEGLSTVLKIRMHLNTSSDPNIPANPSALNGAPPPVPTQTSLRWVHDLTLRLERFDLSDRAAVLTLLNQVARGVGSDAIVAKAVFNDLIAHEAFEVFVEVFTANNAILQAQASAAGRPFKSTLILQLPQDWAPTARAAMVEAFGHIALHRLEALSPADCFAPISNVACEGIASFLSRAGVTEFALCGELACPSVVQQALNMSRTPLDTLELGWTDRQQTSNGQASYEALINVGKVRAHLKHLTIHNGNVTLYFADALHVWLDMPALKSLSLQQCAPRSVPQVLALLNDVVKYQKLAVEKGTAQSRPFTQLSLSFTDARVEDSLGDLFAGLKKVSLTHFDLQTHDFGYSPLCLTFVPLGAEFAFTSPGLTHFKWDSGIVIENAAEMMNTLLRMAPTEDFRQRPASMVAALKNSNGTLQLFSMTGFPVTQGAQCVLFEGVEHNTSLQVVNLSGNCLDIEATQILPRALAANWTIRKIALSNRPSLYSLTAPDGSIHGLRRKQSSSNRSDEAEWGEVELDGAMVGGAAPPVFKADLKAHADTLPMVLYQHERKFFVEKGFAELAGGVAQLMETAVGAFFERGELEKVASALGKDAFDDVAKVVAGFLEQDGALRTAARLSEVRVPVGPHGERSPEPKQTDADVKALVKLNSAMAVEAHLPAAPLAINEVDEDGANVHLVKLVKLGRPFLVSQAIANGAVDFGGQAADLAPWGILRYAFLPANAPDKTGANKQLMADVKARDADGVLRSRAQGAIDFGRKGVHAAKKSGDRKLLAAFVTAVALPKPTTATVTTTNTTAITTTTAATQVRVPPARGPRPDSNTSNS